MDETKVYRHFAELLPEALKGPNIKHVTLSQLRSRAEPFAQKCRNGALAWRSFVSSRIGPKTVYLGSEDVLIPKPTPLQRDIIAQAPDQLHKVLQLLRKLPFVHLRRQMGRNPIFNPVCNLYLSVADPKNARIGYMWGTLLSDPDPRFPGPEFTMIHIPEEHQIRQMVLALPEYGINICLGSDYVGEEKKGFLRQAMHWADRHGMLGLHAGTKIVQVKDASSGRIKRWGVFLFGLSATGKSTWSCHQLGLDHTQGEGTFVIQDDIVFLRPDGSALGSEANFFVKTDVDRNLQEAMWWALTDRTALYENVMVNWKGEPDFLDESLCGNGRAVVRKDKLRVQRGRKMISIAYPSFDLPPIEELDGLIFAFITRRNTVMPFAQELTPKEGVLAYLWGESTHSYASQPEKAGESVRTVGTDPFIVGKRGLKVNRFRDIVMGLVEKYPEKVKFFQYNTGGVGEIIETVDGKKRMVRPAKRVPIDLMAAIQRGDLRGTNRYQQGRLGTREIVEVEGYDLSSYDPAQYYDHITMEAIIADIKKGRRAFTEEVADEGLDREIVRWAEESLQVGVKEKPSIFPVEAELSPKPTYQPPRSIFGDGGHSLYRPSRPLSWRTR